MNKIKWVVVATSLATLAACQTPSGSGGGGKNSEFNCMAGTIGGAVVGGLLGSTIGGGRGRTAMTAVGVGTGGYLGNQMGCH